MKTIFLYEDEIFEDDLLVCVGVDEKRIIKWVEKYGSKESIKAYKDNIDLIKKGIFSGGSLSMIVREDNSPIYLLILSDWKNDWSNIDVLIHEIIHYKQFQFKNRHIKMEEIEFESYYVENTFRQIRKILNKKLK